jgi:uncharacterized membrane protein YfcA
MKLVSEHGFAIEKTNQAGPKLIERRAGALIRRNFSVIVTLLLGFAAVECHAALLADFVPDAALPVMLAIFMASTTSSIVGFAFSALSGAMLFHLLDRPAHIVESMILCSIAVQFFSDVTLRNSRELKNLSRFLLGGLLGLPLGVYLPIHMSPAVYAKVMGGFLIVYGVYMILRRPIVLRFRNVAAGCAAGFLGGITGGFAGFPGAFVTIWCGFKGWTNNQQRGVYQPFILIMQILALTLILMFNPANSLGNKIDLATLSYIPAAVLGTWCGIAIFRRLTEVQFARSVNLLLIVSGLGLIF